MACFLIPLMLCIILLILQKALPSKSLEKINIKILNTLMLGGSALLGLEHVWHGEVVPWPPFLTAMTNPADIPIMLHEMTIVGTSMTAATIALWGSINLAINIMTKIKLNLTGTLKNEKEGVINI